MDLSALRTRVEAAGQGHVFRFWHRLDAAGQRRLAEQLAGINLDLVGRLFRDYRSGRHVTIPADLEPAPVVGLPVTAEEREAAATARAAGEEALRAGRVAALVVAGGQGTRLGWNGPKGTFPAGAVSGKSLFQLQTEKVVAARRRYGRPIPWLVMTSPLNDGDTRAFFASNDWFGLPAEDVIFFVQGTMPVVDADGRLLLDAPDHVAESPNGHGGVLSALVERGVLAELRRRGIDLISYVQVDNVLVRVIDPVFIGRHVLACAEMSSKVCRKRDPHEGVAVVGTSGGRLRVIEYSDLPEDLKHARAADGDLLYRMGSIAIHILSVDFVERVAGRGMLPYHVAHKAVPFVDLAGARVEPAAPRRGSPTSPLKKGSSLWHTRPRVCKEPQPRAAGPHLQRAANGAAPLPPGGSLCPSGPAGSAVRSTPNALKFEMFVFDALQEARVSVTMETAREEEFAPIKRAEGADSPSTARQAMTDQAACWLEAVGVHVPRDEDGRPVAPIELSPLWAADQEEVATRMPIAVDLTRPVYLAP